MSNLKLSKKDLDSIANHYYLKGYVVGRIEDDLYEMDEYLVPELVVGKFVDAVSIDRKYLGEYGSSEIIVTSNGVVCHEFNNPVSGTFRMHWASPKSLNALLLVVDSLIAMDKGEA